MVFFFNRWRVIKPWATKFQLLKFGWLLFSIQVIGNVWVSLSWRALVIWYRNCSVRLTLIIFLRGSVSPGPDNPYPISDQNIRFSIPYISDVTLKMYTLFQTMCGVVISATLNRIYSVPDFVTPLTMCAFFFFALQCPRQHVTAKMVPQTKQTEYTPYLRPTWQNRYPISN